MNEDLDMKELERQMNQLVVKSHLEENLKPELPEFEMLQSMFPCSDEIIFDDPFLLEDFRHYVYGIT